MERAVLRLLGVDGVGPGGVPLANLFVERLGSKRLCSGAARAAGALVVRTGRTVDDVASGIGDGSLEMRQADDVPEEAVRRALLKTVARTFVRIYSRREERERFLDRFPQLPSPSLRTIVGSGNSHEDRTAAAAAAESGAQMIAVMQAPEQLLLDFVPYGATTSEAGGTFATQENVCVMRETLDAVSEQLGRYVMLAIKGNGLCSPEFGVIAAIERIDVLYIDAIESGAACGIDPARAAVDRHFTRALCARSGVMVVEAPSERSGSQIAPSDLGGDGVFVRAHNYWNPFDPV